MKNGRTNTKTTIEIGLQNQAKSEQKELIFEELKAYQNVEQAKVFKQIPEEGPKVIEEEKKEEISAPDKDGGVIEEEVKQELPRSPTKNAMHESIDLTNFLQDVPDDKSDEKAKKKELKREKREKELLRDLL